MRLTLVNPSNPLVGLANAKGNRWNRYRVWRPLGLLVLAGMTPPQWEISIVDENHGIPDYSAMARPDLVGITAFTSQACRAYEVAALFRARGVPVVMGGIHASVRVDEALEHVDAVVTGEGEGVWEKVLADAARGELSRVYRGELADMAKVPIARHDLLPKGYHLGSVQTTRGCPLNCSFCSVSAVNGKAYRQRPIDDVIREMKTIREKMILVVDDNIIGTSRAHIARAKELFRAMIRARLGKHWIGQVTINFGDDDELLGLAAESGCRGVFAGFESPSAEGLNEIGKKFNVQKGRDLAAAVRNIQRHGIGVVASFIIGLDSDKAGIGRRIAEVAEAYGVDLLNLMFLTPLPGTRLWDAMDAEGRIVLNRFPADWKYFTLNCPVATYRHLSWEEMVGEMDECNRAFYSYGGIAKRVLRNIWRSRRLSLLIAAGNLSYLGNMSFDTDVFQGLNLSLGRPQVSRDSLPPGSPARPTSVAGDGAVSAVAKGAPLGAPGHNVIEVGERRAGP